jgi:hypothetical protein
VKIAYWDTAQGGRPPALLGEIKGTPTIRFFKPKKQQKTKGSHAEKIVMDYNQERKVKDMRTFLEYNMPNYAERISFSEDFVKASAKAEKFGLAKAIFFPSKSKTSAVIKFLSTEFRRRLLMVEVVPTTKNEGTMKDHGISTDDLPALIVVTESGEQVKYTGGDFSRRKLERFLSEYAKTEPVYKPPSNPSNAETENKDGEDASAKHHMHSEF